MRSCATLTCEFKSPNQPQIMQTGVNKRATKLGLKSQFEMCVSVKGCLVAFDNLMPINKPLDHLYSEVTANWGSIKLWNIMIF